jgi:hypothetical protein
LFRKRIVYLKGDEQFDAKCDGPLFRRCTDWLLDIAGDLREVFVDLCIDTVSMMTATDAPLMLTPAALALLAMRSLLEDESSSIDEDLLAIGE